jgi:chromosome segregation ATPase
MEECMSIKVVTKSPNFGIGPDETATVPSCEDLDRKADLSRVNEIAMDLGKKAEIARLEELQDQGVKRFTEFEAKLSGKVDMRQWVAHLAELSAAIEDGNWHKSFKEFVESQTRIFVGALNAQYNRFDAHLEALKREVKVGQELPERLQRVAEKHKEEVAALLQSFTESLTQKASEIGRMHKDCLSTRDEIQHELQVIQSLLREANQFRDEAAAFSAKIYEQLKALEGIKQKTKEELVLMLEGFKEMLTQKASEVDRIHKASVTASDDIQSNSQDVQSLMAETKQFRDEARDYSAKMSSQLKGLEGMNGTFWKRVHWLFVGSKPPRS